MTKIRLVSQKMVVYGRCSPTRVVAQGGSIVYTGMPTIV